MNGQKRLDFQSLGLLFHLFALQLYGLKNNPLQKF